MSACVCTFKLLTCALNPLLLIAARPTGDCSAKRGCRLPIYNKHNTTKVLIGHLLGFPMEVSNTIAELKGVIGGTSVPLNSETS